MNEEKKTTGSVPPRAPRPAARTSLVKRNLNPMAEMQQRMNEPQRPATSNQRKPAASVQKPQVSAQNNQVRRPAASSVAPAKAAQPTTARPAQPKPMAPEAPAKRIAAAPAKQVESKVPMAKPAASNGTNSTAAAAQPQPVSNRPAQSAQTAARPAQSRQVVSGREPAPRTIHRVEPERITSPEMQRRRETVNAHKYDKVKKNKSEKAKKINPLKILVAALSFLLTFVVILAGTLFICLKMICGDTSPAAKELLVTTLLETGQMKDVASWFLSAEEIQQIVDDNTMSSFENDIDSSLISIDKTPDDNGDGVEQQDIEVVEISGRTFFGTMLIIKDPSRVELASIYPWKTEGVPLDQLVNDAGAVAGINGGLYNSSNNSGGRPYGVVVCQGEIQLNEPNQFPGLVLIGFTEDDILEIIPVDGMSKSDVENLVAERKIRDAVTFQEEASDKNNHFVQLVINGEARDMNGMGSGLNPRTAIGQRADGSVLLLVTDGRGKAGHLGASASDLINVMVEYGAVNAANLDGGSSSCMYYDGEYLMTSVTFYHSNSSWKLPLGFVVK